MKSTQPLKLIFVAKKAFDTIFPMKNQNAQGLLKSYGIPATDCMIESSLLSESLARLTNIVSKLETSEGQGKILGQHALNNKMGDIGYWESLSSPFRCHLGQKDWNGDGFVIGEGLIHLLLLNTNAIKLWFSGDSKLFESSHVLF